MQIDNHEFNFIYSDSAKCFMATEFIDKVKVNFEIYEEEYNQKEIDWELFAKFVIDLKKNNILPELIRKSQKVLIELANAFGCSIGQNENIEDFHMVLSGLQFRGATDNLFAKNLYNYSLWFTIQNKNIEFSYVDPYGAYITDIEGRFIIGASRRQC